MKAKKTLSKWPYFIIANSINIVIGTYSPKSGRIKKIYIQTLRPNAAPYGVGVYIGKGRLPGRDLSVNKTLAIRFLFEYKWAEIY